MSRESDSLMSSPIDEVTARCSRAYHTGSLLLRGSPAAAGWILGWLSAEFAPHVLTGHALSAVRASPLERIACGLAVQRADTVLETALRETFGEDYNDAVHHPLEPYTARQPSLAGLVDAMRHRRRYSATTTDISYGRAVAAICSTCGVVPTCRRATGPPCSSMCPAGDGRSTRSAVRHIR